MEITEIFWEEGKYLLISNEFSKAKSSYEEHPLLL